MSTNSLSASTKPLLPLSRTDLFPRMSTSWLLVLSLASLVALAFDQHLWGLGGQASEHEAVKSLGALGAALGGLVSKVPAVGSLLGRTLGGSSQAIQTLGQPASSAGLTNIVKAGTKIGLLGAAFETGSRLLPGGQGLDLGPFTLMGSSGGGSSMVSTYTSNGQLVPGAPFGDTFITRMWQSGVTHEGVPIYHGMLANGKRFSTNRYGGIKVFRPRKNIVIGPNPRLSDASKVARAAAKMESASEKILRVIGKKAVKR